MKKDVKKEVKKNEKDKKVSEVKKEKKTKNKVNIFKSIARYFNGVAKETRRIKWTTGKELLKYSVATVAFVVFFGLYFYGIDWLALLIRSLAK